MKTGIHPQLNPIIFVDTSTGKEIISYSTITSDETREIDGVKHFVIKLDVSSFSHPFFTGEMRFVDRQGRVDKFIQKMQKAQSAQPTKKAKKIKRLGATDSAEEDHKSYREILRDKQTDMRQSTKTEKKNVSSQPLSPAN